MTQSIWVATTDRSLRVFDFRVERSATRKMRRGRGNLSEEANDSQYERTAFITTTGGKLLSFEEELQGDRAKAYQKTTIRHQQRKQHRQHAAKTRVEQLISQETEAAATSKDVATEALQQDEATAAAAKMIKKKEGELKALVWPEKTGTIR